jgi:phage terminase small subunit
MTSHIKGLHVSTRARLKPPRNLSVGAAEVFKATVKAVDPDHFSEVDVPLLEQYAVAADLARQAQHHIDENGAVIAGKANSWLVIQEKSVRSLVALSARLRLCPQSRFDRLVAGANSRPQPQDFEDDDELLAGPPNRPRRKSFAANGRRPSAARVPAVHDDDGLLALP